MSLKKVRKEVSGTVRNKQRTRGKLLECIGKILEEETFSGLTITAVYKKSRLNPKLVYLYFNDFDHLVETFVSQRLQAFHSRAKLRMELVCLDSQPDVLDAILQQVEELYTDEPLKRLLHWSLVEKRKKNLKMLTQSFSSYLNELFGHFTKALPAAERQSIIATLDLLVSGTLFLFVYAAEGARFLTLDISNEHDRLRLYNAVKRMVFSACDGQLVSMSKKGIVA
ncbi:TetR/AcrR family transcriptional regulator [Sphingobacterium paludis]|uniref:AcrR family transcriptional regulator n=1 Tax=Sphingobacterium paludis TaxID=1476465 RepID=A0A4R7D141_9SPHI|nr:TetR/AcrR family transcriptional regulator [Sphingobacterium paludis]TDS13761.1 AcrR family transcriptional regulator [Sphingobacterium paludis]